MSTPINRFTVRSNVVTQPVAPLNPSPATALNPSPATPVAPTPAQTVASGFFAAPPLFAAPALQAPAPVSSSPARTFQPRATSQTIQNNLANSPQPARAQGNIPYFAPAPQPNLSVSNNNSVTTPSWSAPQPNLSVSNNNSVTTPSWSAPQPNLSVSNNNSVTAPSWSAPQPQPATPFSIPNPFFSASAPAPTAPLRTASASMIDRAQQGRQALNTSQALNARDGHPFYVPAQPAPSELVLSSQGLPPPPVWIEPTKEEQPSFNSFGRPLTSAPAAPAAGGSRFTPRTSAPQPATTEPYTSNYTFYRAPEPTQQPAAPAAGGSRFIPRLSAAPIAPVQPVVLEPSFQVAPITPGIPVSQEKVAQFSKELAVYQVELELQIRKIEDQAQQAQAQPANDQPQVVGFNMVNPQTDVIDSSALPDLTQSVLMGTRVPKLSHDLEQSVMNLGNALTHNNLSEFNPGLEQSMMKFGEFKLTQSMMPGAKLSEPVVIAGKTFWDPTDLYCSNDTVDTIVNNLRFAQTEAAFKQAVEDATALVEHFDDLLDKIELRKAFLKRVFNFEADAAALGFPMVAGEFHNLQRMVNKQSAEFFFDYMEGNLDDQMSDPKIQDNLALWLAAIPAQANSEQISWLDCLEQLTPRRELMENAKTWLTMSNTDISDALREKLTLIAAQQ